MVPIVMIQEEHWECWAWGSPSVTTSPAPLGRILYHLPYFNLSTFDGIHSSLSGDYHQLSSILPLGWLDLARQTQH